ncbi:skin secretory protein xP2-like [Moschus berezovskii]|uniref:skin secretory protein xP2-like n=1 Tax=Moschus berezovskii TaxID=68408 RepID=UPI0024450C0C|nr:skin secretory protein xP2-like [Moschus berezovskii]
MAVWRRGTAAPARTHERRITPCTGYAPKTESAHMLRNVYVNVRGSAPHRSQSGATPVRRRRRGYGGGGQASAAEKRAALQRYSPDAPNGRARRRESTARVEAPHSSPGLQAAHTAGPGPGLTCGDRTVQAGREGARPSPALGRVCASVPHPVRPSASHTPSPRSFLPHPKRRWGLPTAPPQEVGPTAAPPPGGGAYRLPRPKRWGLRLPRPQEVGPTDCPAPRGGAYGYPAPRRWGYGCPAPRGVQAGSGEPPTQEDPGLPPPRLGEGSVPAGVPPPRVSPVPPPAKAPWGSPTSLPPPTRLMCQAHGYGVTGASANI